MRHKETLDMSNVNRPDERPQEEIAEGTRECEVCGTAFAKGEWLEDEECPVCWPELLDGIFGPICDS